MEQSRSEISGRMFIVLGLVFLLPVAIVLQILRVQIVEGENLRELWNQQAVDSISIPAERGRILDRNGRVLASDKVTFRVAVDPHAPEITMTDFHNIANVLASYSERHADHYINRINQASPNSRYVILDRQVNYEARDDLNELDIPGLIIEEQYRRRYNFESLAAHVLGFTNHQRQGTAGLEASLNSRLVGEDGIQQVRRDRTNQIRQMVGSPRKHPQQGNNLVTTLDTDIQAIAEDELQKGIDRTGAKKGTVIVMNPQSGAIKAMANYPSFDPNRPASTPGENRRNYAVADLIEPGSTFKLITSIAAWENNVVEMDEVFETPESGVVQISGQSMRDHDPLGDLTFPEVIQKSSNIATSEIAMRLDPEVLYQYSRNFGFGVGTGVGLPNEARGKLQRPYEWSGVTKPWLSIGYEIQVTPLQMAQAYAAFANDGKLLRPYLVDRIEDERGRTIEKTEPRKIRQVIDPETIESLKPVFEGVVSDSGTASYASVENLSIAGKTGTAQKFEDGRYQSKYRASFVGFFPAENPKYLTLVLLDEPELSFYGGFNAGPVFRNIAKRLIGIDEEWDLTPDDTDYDLRKFVTPNVAGLHVDQAEEVLRSMRVTYQHDGSGEQVTGQTPEPGELLAPGEVMTLEISEEEVFADEVGRVPDVTGMSMRRGSHLLRKAGYNVEMAGSGTIGAQFPEAETSYRKGRTVTVRGRTTELTDLITPGS